MIWSMKNEKGNVLTYLGCDYNAEWSKDKADKLVQARKREAHNLRVRKVQRLECKGSTQSPSAFDF